MHNKVLLLLCINLAIASCSSSSDENSSCSTETSITSYIDPDGVMLEIGADGLVYNLSDCSIAGTLFEPGYAERQYLSEDGRTFRILDDGALYEVWRNFKEDMEGHGDWTDIFIEDIDDRDHFITNLTLQSPLAKTTSEQLQLRDCLRAQTCDFLDNTVALSSDPLDPSNHVLEFHAVKPSQDMVVSKSSVASDALYFNKGDDFWYSARYYLKEGMPLTIADFESSHVIRWGPRIFIRDGQIEIENKFMDKKRFTQNVNTPISLPTQQWVTVKAHFKFDDETGIIQVWQDDQLIIDHIGQNMPIPNWVLDVLEIGISATEEVTTVLVDDIEFGPNPL